MAETTQPGNKKKIFYGWIIVLASFGINAVVHGIRYSYGVFFKSLGGEFDLTRTMTSGISCVYWVLSAACALLGGWLLDKYGPRKIAITMGLLTAVSLIATGRAGASWQLLFSYSLLLAAGTGAVYSVLMATIQRWFHKKRGLAVGIVSSGVGIGTIVMMPLTAYLIPILDWRTTYLMMGLVLGAIFIILSLPLKSDPAAIGLLPDGAKQSLNTAAVNTRNASGDNSLPLSQALKTVNFWMLAFIWFLWGFSLLLVLTHFVPHLTDLGIPATTAALISGLIGVISIAGRLGFGWVSDRLDRKLATTIAIILQAGPLFLLAWAQQLWMFYLFAAIYAIGYGGIDPTTLALAGDIFGTRYLGKILGALLLFWPLGAGAGSIVGGIIFDATGSYFSAFLLVASAMLAACVCALLIKRENGKTHPNLM
jgi:MFS family permease